MDKIVIQDPDLLDEVTDGLLGLKSLEAAQKIFDEEEYGYSISFNLEENNRDCSEWIVDTLEVEFDFFVNTFEKWKKKSPGEEVLEDLKKVINDSYEEIIPRIFNRLKTEKIINLLVYFGLEEEIYINLMQGIMECINIFDKAFAGKKIANFIENAMDDEFEMKPLRTKIDLRKIKDNRI
jgi:hypothetical protein